MSGEPTAVLIGMPLDDRGVGRAVVAPEEMGQRRPSTGTLSGGPGRDPPQPERERPGPVPGPVEPAGLIWLPAPSNTFDPDQVPAIADGGPDQEEGVELVGGSHCSSVLRGARRIRKGTSRDRPFCVRPSECWARTKPVPVTNFQDVHVGHGHSALHDPTGSPAASALATSTRKKLAPCVLHAAAEEVAQAKRAAERAVDRWRPSTAAGSMSPDVGPGRLDRVRANPAPGEPRRHVSWSIRSSVEQDDGAAGSLEEGRSTTAAGHGRQAVRRERRMFSGTEPLARGRRRRRS